MVQQIINEKQDEIKGRSVVILAQDEGRFGMMNSQRTAWSAQNIRPTVLHKMSREYFYAFSAVCPATGKITSLVLPYANTDMMNLFLEEVSHDYCNDYVIMQVDQAGWHKSKMLKIPENIHLIQQPPYSPELNPAEHIWDEVREKWVCNKNFDSIDNVQTAVVAGLKYLSIHPERIRSMTNFPHLDFSI